MIRWLTTPGNLKLAESSFGELPLLHQSDGSLTQEVR